MEKRTSFRNLSKQDKLAYVWDYWKGPIIAVLFVVIVVSSVVKTIVTHKDPTLAVLMINSSSKDSTYFKDLLSDEYDDVLISLSANLDFDDAGITMGNYMDDTVLSAQLNNNSFDLFFGNGEKFDYIAEDGFMVDLRDILSEEVFKMIPESDLIYSTVNGHTDSYPCAFKVTNSAFKSIYYPSDDVYCGVIYNNPNPSACAITLEKMISVK